MKRLRSRPRRADRRRSRRPLVAASVLVANGATARTASATLVVDNSFTIKTSDPRRAFDPTASLVDHALYDTLFTYKGGDLAHPIPLLVLVVQGEPEREDVHLPAQAERPLRRRHAAHLRRRRLGRSGGSII